MSLVQFQDFPLDNPLPLWYDCLMVPSSRRPRTPPFQGENTGSNPVGTIDNPMPLWYDCLIGTIAQLVEHTPDKGAVTGSSPVGSIPQQRWVEDVFHRIMIPEVNSETSFLGVWRNGRRTRLKICWAAMPVRVQVPRPPFHLNNYVWKSKQ